MHTCRLHLGPKLHSKHVASLKRAGGCAADKNPKSGDSLCCIRPARRCRFADVLDSLGQRTCRCRRYALVMLARAGLHISVPAVVAVSAGFGHTGSVVCMERGYHTVALHLRTRLFDHKHIRRKKVQEYICWRILCSVSWWSMEIETPPKTCKSLQWYLAIWSSRYTPAFC